MTRQRGLAAALIVLVSGVSWARAMPTTQPDVSAAELVRHIRAGENWIEHVQSISIRMESTWIRTPESIAKHTAQLRKQFPRMKVDQTTFPELRPEQRDVTEIAFDAHRFRKLQDRPGDCRVLSIWDGSKGMGRSQYFSNRQDGYYFTNELGSPGKYLLMDMNWPRATPHKLWFKPSDPKEEKFEADIQGQPDEFVVTGREMFHGVDCWVLNLRGYNLHRWWVGVEDHQLHGLGTGSLPKNPRIAEIVKQVASAHGQTFDGPKAMFDWIKTLPKGEADLVYREYFTKLHVTDHPSIVSWMLDYKAVAPDCLLPMTQGYEILSGDFDNPITDLHRDMQVTEVKVNEPLPDDWFRMTLEEGVQVVDRTQDPPLIYKYKKNMTAAEWDSIKKEALDRQAAAAARQASQDAALNKPAPPFPDGGQWLNSSKPLTWSDLKGKPVIVDFWAEWCGPCRNDFPMMAQLHKDREQSGIVVIGIHVAGSDPEKIRQVMKDFGMTYPIFVDVAPAKQRGWGSLYAKFGVRAIPHTFLVDANGIVVAHGSLGEMLQKAHELTRAKQN